MILFTYYIVFILAILMFHVCICGKIENRNRVIIRYLSGGDQEQKLPYILNFYLKDICALEIYFVKGVKLDSVFFVYIFGKFMRRERERNRRSISSKWICRRFTTQARQASTALSSLWVNAYRLFLPYWKTRRLSSKSYSFITPFKCSRKGVKISCNICLQSEKLNI